MFVYAGAGVGLCSHWVPRVHRYMWVGAALLGAGVTYGLEGLEGKLGESGSGRRL
jgi:hypothetical protein